MDLEASLSRTHPAPRRGRALRLAEGLLGLMAAILLMAMMLVTAVDVFGRYLLSRPLPGAYELTEIMLALAVFIGVPLVCLNEENITVTLLTERLPRGVRRLLAGIVTLACAAILGLVAWQLAAHSRQLASYGEVTVFLRVPKGPIGYAMSAFSALGVGALLVVAFGQFRPARDQGEDANRHA